MNKRTFDYLFIAFVSAVVVLTFPIAVDGMLTLVTSSADFTRSLFQ